MDIDGKTLRVNDLVLLHQGVSACVVCSIDTLEYTDAYPELEWSYLKRGVLLLSDQIGLVHCLEPTVGMKVIGHKECKET
jgi:hypothetical protein